MESNKIIYIRTGGGIKTATGHLLRTLAIARACALQHASVTYLVDSQESQALLRSFYQKEEEFPIVVLEAEHLAAEFSMMTEFLKDYKGDLLLIDSYEVTTAYLLSMQLMIKTCYLDDLHSFYCPVDLLVNYDLDTCYSKEDYPHTTLLTGTEFAPLREEFSDTAYEVRESAVHLLISTGGTDPNNLAISLSTGLHARFPDLILHVVCGKLQVHRDELLALSDNASWLILHHEVTDMASLYQSCDLAVSAAGTTLYELCAVGVPSVSYAFADNQVPGANAFERAGIIPYGGDARETDIVDAVSEHISVYYDSKDARIAASAKMRGQVDGNGAKRIAAALMAAVNS